jgi:hypothetical protein
MRRAASRITRADDLLVNTYRSMPDIVSRFLRDEEFWTMTSASIETTSFISWPP